MGVRRNVVWPLRAPGKKGQHVHFCSRHAPSPWTHILPLSLETLKLSGSITNRHHAPSHIFRENTKFCSRNTFKYIYFLRRGNFSRGGQTGSCPSNLSPLLCTSLVITTPRSEER